MAERRKRRYPTVPRIGELLPGGRLRREVPPRAELRRGLAFAAKGNPAKVARGKTMIEDRRRTPQAKKDRSIHYGLTRRRDKGTKFDASLPVRARPKKRTPKPPKTRGRGRLR